MSKINRLANLCADTFKADMENVINDVYKEVRRGITDAENKGYKRCGICMDDEKFRKLNYMVEKYWYVLTWDELFKIVTESGKIKDALKGNVLDYCQYDEDIEFYSLFIRYKGY